MIANNCSTNINTHTEKIIEIKNKLETMSKPARVNDTMQ